MLPSLLMKLNYILNHSEIDIAIFKKWLELFGQWKHKPIVFQNFSHSGLDKMWSKTFYIKLSIFNVKNETFNLFKPKIPFHSQIHLLS